MKNNKSDEEKNYDNGHINNIAVQKTNANLENSFGKKEEKIEEMAIIETSQWTKIFKSKEEAADYCNKKGAEFGIEFKILSVKNDIIELKENERTITEKKAYSFTLFCKEHFWGTISQKDRQLEGCEAQINFILDKNSIQINDSKLDVMYTKSISVDIHNCKPNKLKIENRKLIKTSFKDDIAHFDKRTPVKFIKKFINSKRGHEINVSFGKVWYEFNKREIKYKDKDASILI